MRQIACSLVVLCCSSGIAWSASVQSIVAAFYPPSLQTLIDGPVPANEQTYSYVVGDLDGSGTQEIAAAYSNGVSGAIRVLSPAGNGALLATAEPPNMSGRKASVRLVNVNGSHRPLIVVTMEQRRGLPATWIFRWTGSALAPVGPLRRAETSFYQSALADVSFVDLDGNGTLSIIDRHAGLSSDEDGTLHADQQNRIYRYVNGQLQPGEVADYYEGFLRATGQPAEQRSSFEITNPAAARQLVIVNGGVSSAVITLNRQPIVGPSSFNQNTRVIRVAVTLLAKNEIGVKLDGKPGSTLSILVLPK